MNNRAFKGIWIPAEIWLNERLSVMEKLFLVEIDSLDNDEGCRASNAHFSDFFNISKGRCTQIIKGLEAKNLIAVVLIRNGKVITKRLIRVVNKLNRGSENIKQGYLENAEGSNTSKNNTKNMALSEEDQKTFDNFWEIYPRRTAKPNAKKAFKKLKDKLSIVGLVSKDVHRRINNGEWDLAKMQFIPHPATYLNGERWNDEQIFTCGNDPFDDDNGPGHFE